MPDVADIARQQFRDALAGKMHRCEVSKWLDDNGQPVQVYWKPLTGAQQREIDQAGSEVAKVCQLVKLRALDADGKPIFADTSLAALQNDFDYDELRALAYIIAGDIGQDTDPIETAAGE